MLWRALLVLVPISLVLAAISAVPRAIVFVVAILAIIPLAEWVRRSTEHVAARAGSAPTRFVAFMPHLRPPVRHNCTRIQNA